MCRASLRSRNLGTFLLGQHPGLSSDSSGMAGWAAESPPGVAVTAGLSAHPPRATAKCNCDAVM